ncbi:MAG: hypothetical protein WBL37_08925 [Dehalococcoidales bacterium]
MTNYEQMRKKWQTRLKLGKAEGCFDSKKLTPGKFCVHITDCGGTSMSNMSEIEITGYFESPQDFLGYLRFAKISSILDVDTQTYQRPYPAVADSYLGKYEKDKRNEIDWLLGQIDKYLISEVISGEQLSDVLDTFNAAFMDTNPEVQLLAWGSVYETLTSPYFREGDEDQNMTVELRELLESGNFDETKQEDLNMARDYFESRINA